MTLSSDINTTSTALKNIKDAINNKGGSASGSITTYPNAISNILIPVVINREVSAQGVYQAPTTSFTFSLPSNATNLGNYALYYAFYGCTGLTSVDFSNLTSISGIQALYYAFYGCTSLTTLSFPSLTSTSFGTNTNQFNNMLNGVSGCTVHFPSNLQSVIGSWSDVTAGFGGTNTTVLFDLPATT